MGVKICGTQSAPWVVALMMLASCVPARNAIKVDPSAALRGD